MIYDSVKHIDSYTSISDDIRLGLEYLRDFNPGVKVGVHELTPRVKAIVSEYTTKHENEFGYEAHRKYIDIQYLISGVEKICSLPLYSLKETKAYKEDIDAAFFEENGVKPQELILGNGHFAIFFPVDGHMPQLCVDLPKPVKKLVIKVRIGE